MAIKYIKNSKSRKIGLQLEMSVKDCVSCVAKHQVFYLFNSNLLLTPPLSPKTVMLQPCVTEKQMKVFFFFFFLVEKDEQMKFSQERLEKENDETNQCIQLGKSNQAVTNGRNYVLLLLTI